MSTKTLLDDGDGGPIEPNWPDMYQDAVDQDFVAREWAIVVKEMRERDILSAGNGNAILRLVDARLRHEHFRREADEGGTMKQNKRNGLKYVNPAVCQMKSMDEQIRQLESELGIAPLRRSRAGKVQRKKRQVLARDAYLQSNLRTIQGGKSWGK